MKKDIASIIRDHLASKHEEIIAMREHIHRHPELSFEEYETSAFIQRQLDHLGISYEAGICDTGVVAEIGQGEVCVALRADIDALPITEQNTHDYQSKHEGVMHACGHDVHTSCLLGAASALKQIENELPGRVRLIFQPGEEKLPGGASQMITAGVLQDPVPAVIIGQHVHPELEVGKCSFRGGPSMASTDEIYITIEGVGGHGAMPHLARDPIAAAAAVISACYQLVQRRANPVKPMVFTIGKIQSDGGATNVIPSSVRMDGTFRCLDEEMRTALHADLQTCVEHTASAHGCKADWKLVRGYPYLHNDEEWSDYAMQSAAEYLGADDVLPLELRMTAEDFSYYSQEISAVFYRLGVRNEAKGIVYPVHHPRFDADPEALLHGSGMMAWLAYRALQRASSHKVTIS